MSIETRPRGPRRVAALVRRAVRPFQRIWPRLPEAVLGIAAVGIVVFATLTHSAGVAERASRLVTGHRYLAFADGMLNPFRGTHLLVESGLPIYDLKLSPESIAGLEHSAALAREAGVMTEGLRDWVPGTFIAEGRRYRVDVRLRGDLPPHWEGAKKSYRIKFDSQKLDDNGTTIEEDIYFHGRRQINLIIPIDRDYAVSPFVADLMADEGLVAPRGQFVVLRINGRLQGLYYEVEQFDKPLMAAYDRPETTIFGQNGRAQHFEQYTSLGTGVASDARFDMGSVRETVDPAYDLGMPLVALLNAHERQPSPATFRRARAALDWDKYLAFRAVTTLLNTNHVRFGSDNLKLYFDASRGLLEPVPWDAHLVRMPVEPGTIDFWNEKGPDALQRSTLEDPALRLERNRLLWKWVGDGGASLMRRYDAIHDRIRLLAWADVLGSLGQGYKMDVLRRDLKHNVERVHKVLGLSSANLVYRQLGPDLAAIDVSTLNFSGMHLRTLTLHDSTTAPEGSPIAVTDSPTLTLRFAGRYLLVEDVNEDGAIDPGEPVVAHAVAADGRVTFAVDRWILPEVAYKGEVIGARYWEFMDTLQGRRHYLVRGHLAPAERDPLVTPLPALDVAAVNAVTGAPMVGAVVDPSDPPPVDGTVGIVAYDASDPFDPEARFMTREAFLARHPQFRPLAGDPGAVTLGGSVVITRTVIVPEGARLVIQPGADITLAPATSVLMYGGLEAVGTPEQRIRIHGDGSGRPWDVFAVVRPPRPVELRHTDISDGGQGQVNGMLFTGGFAVHNGDLTLVDARFTDMQSEDAINIKNGHLQMVESLVARTASDGIDVDFGTGEIRDSLFEDITGDGIDFSGSTVTVTRTRVARAGDKCISVGEASTPTIVNNVLMGCNIGLSTKDLSDPRVAYNTFVGNRLALEAKRKKAMFGGGAGTFVNNVFAENGVMLEEDYFSRGQVQVRHALTDAEIARCATCRVVDAVPFRDAANGDWRLAPEALRRLDVGTEAVEWAVDAAGAASGPGVYSLAGAVGQAGAPR